MAKIWTFFATMIVLVPLAWLLVIRTVFGGTNGPANPNDYSFDARRNPLFLSPHNRKGNTVALPLSTRGRYIVDENGARVKLVSVNWYGASDGGFSVGGLDVRHRSEIARVIKLLGFNSVRLPYSDELVRSNPVVNATLLSANQDLVGQRAVDIYTAVVQALTDEGLFVMVNNHITQSTWCCGLNPCDGLWKNDQWGPFCRVRQTLESWIANWETIMRPHVSNPFVVGCDLRNEVRGITDKFLWSSWTSAAEEAAARLHTLQPQWLIVVEGTSSANDLSGAATKPVHLPVPNKLVYSAHVYGWSGWGSLVPYSTREYASFAADMRHKWAYLLEQNIAPVWVGEFGAPREPSEGDLHYWNNLIRFMAEVDVDFAYWALNPRKWYRNETETYSLVWDDWKTPVLDYRLADMLRIAMTQ